MGIDLGASDETDRSEPAPSTDPVFSTREIAAKTGLRPEFVLALRRAVGLPVADADERVCSQADIEGAALARHYLDEGVSEERQLAVVQVLGREMAHAAEAMRAAGVEDLIPIVGPMLEQMLALHLRHMVHAAEVSAAERDGGLLGAQEVTVCFADLVGFTRLGEEVAPDELGRVAQRLVDLTGEHLRGDVRLVKAIGDAAMLVAPEPAELVEVALELVDAANAEGRDFPQLRVGMASGSALGRAGDWYGHPVNLASRVTGVARPGSVLATREVRDAAVDAYRWSSAGARSLKGLDDPVRLYRVRRLARAPG